MSPKLIHEIIALYEMAPDHIQLQMIIEIYIRALLRRLDRVDIASVMLAFETALIIAYCLK